jgi:UDP-3-O-[3-hydroxymyristoyl] N-acetylglucosamine deacetylase
VPRLPILQHTLSQAVAFTGVGLHSGVMVRVKLKPAPVGQGIVFIRTDISDRDNRVEAAPLAVAESQLHTRLVNAAGVQVSTIEHLMAALAALSVDNVTVELDGQELPILDGSAAPFVKLIDQAGRRAQEAPRRYVEILKPVEVVDGGKRASLLPAPGFEVAFQIDFASTAIGSQSIDLEVTEQSFRQELSAARTFGFLHEVEALRAKGLALGGSLDNAVVIDGDTVLNEGGLRFERDEFVRHKALDAIGDLYVLGAPLIGRFEGVRAGHAINNAVVRALVAQPDAWRYRVIDQELAEAV